MFHCTGPAEHMGTVGICPHLLLPDTPTLLQSLWTDYAHYKGLSQLNLKMFYRACIMIY
jgi:hypothetical protein